MSATHTAPFDAAGHGSTVWGEPVIKRAACQGCNVARSALPKPGKFDVRDAERFAAIFFGLTGLGQPHIQHPSLEVVLWCFRGLKRRFGRLQSCVRQRLKNYGHVAVEPFASRMVAGKHVMHQGFQLSSIIRRVRAEVHNQWERVASLDRRKTFARRLANPHFERAAIVRSDNIEVFHQVAPISCTDKCNPS